MKNANLVWVGGRAVLVAVLLALGLEGCERPVAAAPSKAKTVADYFEIKVGPKPVRMQIAVLEPEMERGLMGRKNLGADEGMLFVYARPQRLSFWMRNTPTPLDIGFFDRHGMLEEVYQMHPFDETPVRSRSTLLSLALEMNQGWFRKNEIKPGMELDLKALAAALKARGFEPARFGFEE